MIKNFFGLRKKRHIALVEKTREELEEELRRDIHVKEVELSQLHEVTDIARKEAQMSRIDLRRSFRERRRILGSAINVVMDGFDSSVKDMSDDLNGGKSK